MLRRQKPKDPDEGTILYQGERFNDAPPEPTASPPKNPDANTLLDDGSWSRQHDYPPGYWD